MVSDEPLTFGRTVRVREREGEMVAGNAGLLGQARGDFLDHRQSHAEAIERHEDQRRVVAAANRQCFGEDVLTHALGLSSRRPPKPLSRTG